MGGGARLERALVVAVVHRPVGRGANLKLIATEGEDATALQQRELARFHIEREAPFKLNPRPTEDERFGSVGDNLVDPKTNLVLRRCAPKLPLQLRYRLRPQGRGMLASVLGA